MVEKVILHIGLHKTGTTSVQHYLRDTVDRLRREHDIAVYKPILHLRNGYVANEVGIAIARPGVFDAFPEHLVSAELRENFDKQAWYARIRDWMAELCETDPAHTLLVSGENISWLRTPEEAARLRAMFPVPDDAIEIVLCLRDTDSWWVSYCNQMTKLSLTGTPGHNSQWHLDRDGWLTDFDGLIAALRTAFPTITLIEYGDAMVATFMEAIGHPVDLDREIRENRSGARRPLLRRIRHAIVRGLSGTMVQRIWRRVTGRAGDRP